MNEPSPTGYEGRVDGGAHPALDLLLERGWSKDIVRDGDGTPLDCTACPFSSRSIEPYEHIANDVSEAHYACSLLGRVVWGEYAPCRRVDWIRAETRREQEMTTEGYVEKHMAAHLPPIDRLAGAFKHIPTPVQLIKIVEEVGEAGEAFIGIDGWNPRKGATHTIEDFHKELLDIALTALMLYRNTGGGPPLGRLSAHIEARWERHEREVVRPEANVPRDSRGTLIKPRCRVVAVSGPVPGQSGTVVATRSGNIGRGVPEALVRWGGGEETWHACSEMTVWLTEEPSPELPGDVLPVERDAWSDWSVKPSDWRNATIVDRARVMLRETPAGPRGTVIGNAPEGMVTAQHEVLVRWVGVAKPVWEVASSLEVA